MNTVIPPYKLYHLYKCAVCTSCEKGSGWQGLYHRMQHHCMTVALDQTLTTAVTAASIDLRQAGFVNSTGPLWANFHTAIASPGAVNAGISKNWTKPGVEARLRL